MIGFSFQSYHPKIQKIQILTIFSLPATGFHSRYSPAQVLSSLPLQAGKNLDSRMHTPKNPFFKLRQFEYSSTETRYCCSCCSDCCCYDSTTADCSCYYSTNHHGSHDSMFFRFFPVLFLISAKY